MLQLDVPSAAGEVLLWSHVCLAWMLVQYGHRFDPLGRAMAEEHGEGEVRSWSHGVLARALIGALLTATLAGFSVVGITLGGLFLIGGAAIPLARRRFMGARSASWGRDLRAELELAGNVLFLSAAGFVIAGGEAELEWDERAWVEYFLIGTLASAGLASITGIGLRWLLLSS